MREEKKSMKIKKFHRKHENGQEKNLMYILHIAQCVYVKMRIYKDGIFYFPWKSKLELSISKRNFIELCPTKKQIFSVLVICPSTKLVTHKKIVVVRKEI